MSAPIPNISSAEDVLSTLIRKPNFSDDEGFMIAYTLGSILDGVFPEMNSGMKGWSVDDLYIEAVEQTSHNITLSGKVLWISGGNTFTHYQVDIIKDSSPLIYSYIFKNRKGDQLFYLGKSQSDLTWSNKFL